MTRKTAGLVTALLRQRDEAEARFDAERQRWEAERQLLLTRIQDPTAATSVMMAAPVDMSMDYAASEGLPS